MLFTFDPFWRNVVARAFPIPLPPPIIIATFPSNFILNDIFTATLFKAEPLVLEDRSDIQLFVLLIPRSEFVITSHCTFTRVNS